jgi:hypothetical protein
LLQVGFTTSDKRKLKLKFSADLYRTELGTNKDSILAQFRVKNKWLYNAKEGSPTKGLLE